MYQLLQECVIQIRMVWNIMWAFCGGFLKHSDVCIYQTAGCLCVTYTGRKTLSCSQLDTVSLSPVFHACFLKGTNLVCKCHPSCVVWTSKPGSTTHIFRPSYAEFGNFILSWLLNAFTGRKYPVILGPWKTKLQRKLRLYSVCLLNIFMTGFLGTLCDWNTCWSHITVLTVRIVSWDVLNSM
jgi:hypothetical protein